MKLRSAITLEEFRDLLDPEKLDWDIVAGPWRDRFGERFSVAAFERIFDGQEAFLRDFADWAGLALKPGLDLGKPVQVNKSFSDRQLEIALMMIPKIREDERDLLRRFLMKLT